MKDPTDHGRARDAMRRPGQGDPMLADPFESFAENLELRWPPHGVSACEVVQVLYKDYYGVALSRRNAEIRGRNWVYRTAYPGDRISYREAVCRVLAGDDNTFFKLVRVFGRQVEEYEPDVAAWFRAREAVASQKRDLEFFQRYAEARHTPIREQPHKHHMMRSLLLAVFEPELRHEPLKTIMAFLQEWHDHERLPKEQLPPTLNSLKQQRFQWGWKKVR